MMPTIYERIICHAALQRFARNTNGYARFALWAGVLPHVCGTALIFLYWLTRWQVFSIVIIYAAFACMALVVGGLLAVVMELCVTRKWSDLTWWAFSLLVFNFPASFIYASAAAMIFSSVTITIENGSAHRVTNVVLQVDNKSMKLRDIQPRKTTRLIYYGGGDSDTEYKLTADANANPILITEPNTDFDGHHTAHFFINDAVTSASQ